MEAVKVVQRLTEGARKEDRTRRKAETVGGGLGAEGRYPKTVVLLWLHPRDEKQADVSGQRSPDRRQRQRIPGGQNTQAAANKGVPRNQWQSCP